MKEDLDINTKISYYVLLLSIEFKQDKPYNLKILQVIQNIYIPVNFYIHIIKLENLEVYKKMSLVVKAKVKEAAKGMNVASDFADALDAEVQNIVKRACKRADANGRKTVQSRDL